MTYPATHPHTRLRLAVNTVALYVRLCKLAGVLPVAKADLPTLEQAWELGRQYLPNNGAYATPHDMSDALLGQNAKLKKTPTRRAAVVKGVSLAASTLSGKNLCAFSTPGCRKVCLHASGHGSMRQVQDVRLARTLFLQAHPEAFCVLLSEGIRRFAAACARKGEDAYIRLNVLSDLPWEHIAPWLFTDHPTVSFYDYTKVPGRTTPDNYRLTLSYTGHNGEACAQHLAKGGSVAVVVDINSRSKKGESLPDSVWLGGEIPTQWPVVDGDLHDIRPIDPVGHVAALRYKPAAGAKMSDAGDFLVQLGRMS